ncbi:multidrug ABC transporter ATP-binding protein [Fructilactobacillus lindneri]|uniref:ABC-type transporter ATP-binding protein ecsA n=2 Tax=Fructilactobacillus lindneri TaxID=53444 RepID=A0A0R2JXA9_9LACO|nr:ABC transporter ATP-binding protein [Fructilactobacillus lindneri]ANZ58283.1 multidrug ABC transporter ATP-binding protein [Fructilactobacillus lindneri]ANZ59605.1 multidrug ABC transporter ATP-binding protein [Fructilactobacillus lindneri]KRN79111.1 ABC-type transporter ATP-binding protein ecsA [Fructilactobacillus lindneri DSM 20690 = JCM 11027]POG98611.1 multidrug ABC transporter ATP-binding protein [Fructilactobacillus lindneri]POH03999.1 multidrug ABC transporter ATP-binding protein [F
MSLEVNKLTGGYSSIPVLKNESFDVKDGELVSLIGLNGAGKSTTINHIMGLMTPFSGTIKVNGIQINEDVEKYKQEIAYVPEMPILYPELTLKEHIDTTIMAYNLNYASAWEKAHQLLKTFRLNNKLDWFPANFSKGMRQKVMIVCAFITNAKLFVIDEPFLGLDPLAVNDLLKIIENKKKMGASILMSTHVLDTAEKYCDRFVLLNDGKVNYEGTMTDIKQRYSNYGNSLNDIYLALARNDSHE